MPASARKSSLGTSRRGPQKYIPYRADDLQHGKRTGIAVGYVDRNSDEFEPFDQVIRQADLRTPPKPRMQTKKKRAPKTPIIELDDEDGEMSMELEDSVPNSPEAYFSNARGTITSSVQRVGSSSRPVASRSDVDFDKIPSPRPLSSVRRQTATSARSSGSSRLSRINAAHVSDDDSVYGGGFDDDFDMPGPPSDGYSDQDHTPVPRTSKRHLSSGRPSFAPMEFNHEDGEDEDEEARVEEEVDMVPTQIVETSYPATGRLEPVLEHEEMSVEDDIARELADIELQPEEDEQVEEPQEPVEEEPEPPQQGKNKGRGKGKGRTRDVDASLEKDQRPNKRARKENDDTEVRKMKSGSRKENVLHEVVHDQNLENETGLRRGSRMRYKPLEWWRLEKVVYGRRDSGECLVPTIKEIHRLPKEEGKPLAAKHRRKRQTRSKSVTIEPELTFNPEEGWDENTQSEGIVLDYKTKKEVKRRIAYTAKMVQTRQAANADFQFQKIFGDGDFMASGQLIIPPNSQKPPKNTKDNTFVFYIIEGAVTFRVYRTSYILTTGSMFLVPRGNQYFIQNISDRDARLFFAQARKRPPSKSEGDGEESDSSRSPSMSRSVS